MIALSRIWTWVAVSISYNNNYYTIFFVYFEDYSSVEYSG